MTDKMPWFAVAAGSHMLGQKHAVCNISISVAGAGWIFASVLQATQKQAADFTWGNYKFCSPIFISSRR